MFMFNEGVLIPIFGMLIPIVAIIGGITSGIVKMILRHRTVELAQRERIAAIERGIDVSQLPPLPAIVDEGDSAAVFYSPRQAAMRNARGLLIGGIITLAVAIGLGLMLLMLNTGTENVWAVAIIPGCVGLALLAAALIVRATAGEEEPHAPHVPPHA